MAAWICAQIVLVLWLWHAGWLNESSGFTILWAARPLAESRYCSLTILCDRPQLARRTIRITACLSAARRTRVYPGAGRISVGAGRRGLREDAEWQGSLSRCYNDRELDCRSLYVPRWSRSWASRSSDSRKSG